jgi:hypothetical protein
MFYTTHALAQNRTAWHSSNYTASTSMQSIPTASLTSLQKWDATLAGGGAFVNTDYVFFKNASVPDVLRNRENIVVVDQLNAHSSGDFINPNAVYLHFRQPNAPMNNQLNTTALGPAFSMKFKDLGLGIYTRSVAHFNANRVDTDLAFHTVNAWSEQVLYNISPLKINFMQWNELGVNAAYELRVNRRYRFMIGVNVKRLWGGDVLQARTNGTLQEVGDSLMLLNASVELDFATNYQIEAYQYSTLGKGWGTDIGVTFIKESRDDRPYEFKVDLGLNQLGFIRYETNAESHLFTAESSAQYDENDFNGATSAEALVVAAAQEYYGGNRVSLQSNTFSAGTPAYFLINADWSFTENWFLNASSFRRVQFSKKQAEAINSIGITPRYESNGLSFGLPLLLVDDRNARLGAFLRLGIFTIGSDHLLSWVTDNNELTGTDVYASVNLMNLSWFNGNGNGWGKGRRGRDIKCFEF